jgi:transposase-like protein
MAGRAKFTESDKAQVFVALTANDGNIKRTVRDTGVPESTIRRWKVEWEKTGPPDIEAITAAIDDFYVEAEDVRYRALTKMREKIDDPKTTLSALVAAVGMLDDKIARVKGIGQSRKVEHTLALPTAQEAQELMRGFLQAGIEAARKRDEEIIEAEFVEQPRAGLPAPR